MAAEPARLALIEVFDRDGRLPRQFDVTAWPVRIGRGMDCHLVLDDPHIAGHHATLELDEQGELQLTAGPSLNGLRVGRRKLQAGQRLPLTQAAAQDWQLGLTRLRLRMPGEVLADEVPLGGTAERRRSLVTAGCALALWALLLGEHWVQLDPGSKPSDWLTAVFGPPLALLLWSGLWAVVAKLFRHRFEFEVHFALAVRFALLLTVLGSVLPQLAAALAWPGLFSTIEPLIAIVSVVWLARHGALVFPQRRKTLGAMAVGMLVAAGATGMTLRHQNEAPLVGPLYMSVLPTPGWRLSRPITPDEFVERAGSLRGQLDQRARTDADDADSPESDGEDQE